MKNTPFEAAMWPRLPPEQQRRRVQRVIDLALPPRQRQVLVAYHFQKQTITQIAQELGLHKSTVCRTLHRAERRLREHLKY